MKLVLLSSALALSCVSLTAFADVDSCGREDGGNFDKCWYVGLGLGLTHVDPEGTSDTLFSTDDDSSTGISIHIGQHFKPKYFWEFKYLDAGSAGLGNPNPALDAIGAEIDYTIPSLFVGRTLWDPSRNFNLYGKLGLSRIETDPTDSRIGEEKQSSIQLAFGLGAQYRFDDSPWFARLELDSYDRDAKYLSLSISRYFGGRKHDHSIAAPAVVAAPVVAAPKPKPKPEPKIDSDNDGVYNNQDICPQTPQGTPVDESGCALFSASLEGVNFRTNSAELTEQAQDILDEAAETLAAYPAVRVEVQAHTDSQGAANYNQDLSSRRAISVTNYLVNRGIDRSRLSPRGYGETQPIATNETAQGRAKNRRVSFRTLDF